MNFVCLDGSLAIVELKPSKYPPRKISTIQTAARERIKQEFGDQIILEEFPIPKSKMRVDFFLPKINVVVEVHGRQHFEFVKHFHGTKKKFLQAKVRDNQKAEWCRLNDFELIIWSDTDEQE